MPSPEASFPGVFRSGSPPLTARSSPWPPLGSLLSDDTDRNQPRNRQTGCQAQAQSWWWQGLPGWVGGAGCEFKVPADMALPSEPRLLLCRQGSTLPSSPKALRKLPGQRGPTLVLSHNCQRLDPLCHGQHRPQRQTDGLHQPSQTPGLLLTATRKEDYRQAGLRPQPCFQADGARLPMAARPAPHSGAPCSGPWWAWDRVDLGGLVGAPRVSSKVFLGCFMEIILWSV